MWIWWIISLIILIACMIFTYRMIVTSYQFLPSDKRSFRSFYKMPLPEEVPSFRPESIRTLKSRVQDFEDNSEIYEIQIHKLQERIRALEERDMEQIPSKIKAPQAKIIEEDWKELFYEENEKKEKLENELDHTRQLLEVTELKLQEAKDALYKSPSPRALAPDPAQEMAFRQMKEELEQTSLLLADTQQKLQDAQLLLEEAREKDASQEDLSKRALVQLENELQQSRQVLRVTEKQLEETREALEIAKKVDRNLGDPEDKKTIAQLQEQLSQQRLELKDTQAILWETKQSLMTAQAVEVIQSDPRDKETISQLQLALSELNARTEALESKLRIEEDLHQQTRGALEEAKKVEVIQSDPRDKETISQLRLALSEQNARTEALESKLRIEEDLHRQTRGALEEAKKVEMIQSDPRDKETISQLQSALISSRADLEDLGLKLSLAQIQLRQTREALEEANKQDKQPSQFADREKIAQLQNELIETQSALKDLTIKQGLYEIQLKEAKSALESAKRSEVIQGDPADKKAIAQLENELHQTRQSLKETEIKLSETRDALDVAQKVEVIQGDPADKKTILTLEKQIEALREQLGLGLERERELEQLLMSEVTIREKYAVLKEEYDQLKMESEALKQNLENLGEKDQEIERQQAVLHNLELKLAASEEDRARLKASLLRIIESK